jgi:uncharacterized protein YggE
MIFALKKGFQMAAAGLRDTKKLKILPVAGLLAGALFMAFPVVPAQAQSAEPKTSAEARVIVIGEGSVTVTPDYARIRSGVSTSAKTVTEASDANAKTMSAMLAALADAGIAKKDIQTAEFSIEPVYASPAVSSPPKLTGYRVSNQVNVVIRQIAQVGEILDRLVKAGATDFGGVAFLVSDRDKALDQAREAAIANARHKAELYARASGLNLGRVAFITERSDLGPILPMGVARSKMASTSVPIETGEDTITARVTVGFDIAQ